MTSVPTPPAAPSSGSDIPATIRERWALPVGLALLSAFVVLFVIMVRTANTSDEVHWSRLTYLFGSAEAIVFAFIGWLFGREVHRQRAEVAEKSARQAEERTDAAGAALRQEAVARSSAEARGLALADAVRAARHSNDEQQPLAGPEDSRSADPSLIALANTLFPRPSG